eukprot:3033001-Pleurochrysis_carterae.AAC.2
MEGDARESPRVALELAHSLGALEGPQLGNAVAAACPHANEQRQSKQMTTPWGSVDALQREGGERGRRGATHAR